MSPTVLVARAPVWVEMVETGTLTTLPYCSVDLTVASYWLAIKAFSTGAWPGVNQAAGRSATVLRELLAIASPYQVLRVANWSAGMLNFGM